MTVPATNPATGAIGDPIQTKSGSSTCNIPRPDGSAAGVTALENTGTTTGHPCLDFARSYRAREPGDPTFILFLGLAGDAVTYATQPGSNAPANLTTAQLTGIYNCTITNWSQVGGGNAPIAAMLPQDGSDTRAFFLPAIGLTAPGSCVSTSATVQGAAGNGANTLQEDQGVAPSLNTNKANVIVPFSVSRWIASASTPPPAAPSASVSPTRAAAPRRAGWTCSAAIFTARWCSTRSTALRQPPAQA